MHQPPFEVADVIRSLAAADGRVPGLRASQAGQRVMRDLAACRTAKLGGHVDACDACGEVRVSYNSCRNRHCPKCQAQQRAKWLENRCQDLLPVPYFHVVFTLPAELAPLALHNQREIYGALFAAAAATLRTIAADPQHLGAQIGFLSGSVKCADRMLNLRAPVQHRVIWLGRRRLVGAIRAAVTGASAGRLPVQAEATIRCGGAAEALASAQVRAPGPLGTPSPAPPLTPPAA